MFARTLFSWKACEAGPGVGSISSMEDDNGGTGISKNKKRPPTFGQWALQLLLGYLGQDDFLISYLKLPPSLLDFNLKSKHSCLNQWMEPGRRISLPHPQKCPGKKCGHLFP